MDYNRPSSKVLPPRRSLLPALLLSLSALAAAPLARAADPPAAPCNEVTVGTTLAAATIQDANKQPAAIPNLGEKVLLVLYTDPDVADQNDPFADMVKAQHFDETYYKSIGIANMADAPAKPNWIIRAIVRSKIKKYNVTILTDPDRSLINQWQLCDCNNKSVVILIGKDKKLKYFKKGSIRTDKDPTTGKSEADKVIELLKKEIAEAGGPAT